MSGNKKSEITSVIFTARNLLYPGKFSNIHIEKPSKLLPQANINAKIMDAKIPQRMGDFTKKNPKTAKKQINAPA